MNFYDTDFHCHILPGIDDGAADLDVSLALIKEQAAQGVKTIVATPHYRKHQMSVSRFLKRRQEAYESVMKQAYPGMPRILLSAEIALEHNLYELEDIEQLGNAEMNTLLLEFPFTTSYHKWMLEEVEEISYKTHMQIIIAHIDRYVNIFSESEINEILSIPDAIFQFNLSAFSERKGKKLVKKLIKEEYPILFGTDCHNMGSRKPNFDVLAKHMKKYEPHPRVLALFE